MSTEFVMSASNWEQLPQHNMPELAVTGRSNVGKSSLLNALFKRDKIVRTSRTPGRTQLLNLFYQDEKIAWVDLPGYGYAKLSQQQRAQMEAMSHAYMAKRQNLNGVLMLVDARREQTSVLDQEMAEWVLQKNRPLLVVITKIDLIPKNKRMRQIKQIEASLGLEHGYALACSAHTKEGLVQLHSRIWELVG